MKNINSRTDYYNVVKSIATEVVAIALEDESLIEGGCVDASELIDLINNNDLVHELVDISQYMIYNAHHAEILKYSDNDNALIKEFGSDAISDADTFSEVEPRFAFWALYSDVWEVLQDELGSVMPEGVELV